MKFLSVPSKFVWLHIELNERFLLAFAIPIDFSLRVSVFFIVPNGSLISGRRANEGMVFRSVFNDFSLTVKRRSVVDDSSSISHERKVRSQLRVEPAEFLQQALEQ